jgi:hypothetical protein
MFEKQSGADGSNTGTVSWKAKTLLKIGIAGSAGPAQGQGRPGLGLR